MPYWSKTIRILSICVKGFRSIDHTGAKIEFPEGRNHAILIGKNGVGKSNFLKGMFQKTRVGDDKPILSPGGDPEVTITFDVEGAVYTKVINPIDTKFKIVLPTTEVEKLNERDDLWDEEDVEKIVNELATYKPKHTVESSLDLSLIHI